MPFWPLHSKICFSIKLSIKNLTQNYAFITWIILRTVYKNSKGSEVKNIIGQGYFSIESQNIKDLKSLPFVPFFSVIHVVVSEYSNCAQNSFIIIFTDLSHSIASSIITKSASMNNKFNHWSILTNYLTGVDCWAPKLMQGAGFSLPADWHKVLESTWINYQGSVDHRSRIPDLKE